MINATGDCGGTDPAAIGPVTHPAAVTAVPGICHGNVGEQDALPEEGVELWGADSGSSAGSEPSGQPKPSSNSPAARRMERQCSAEGSWGLKVQLRREPDREETWGLMIAGCSCHGSSDALQNPEVHAAHQALTWGRTTLDTPELGAS